MGYTSLGEVFFFMSLLAMTAAIRKHLIEHPEDFDPRQYLTDARAELVKMYADKNKNGFGSAGHALD